jgi:hypothetical protein
MTKIIEKAILRIIHLGRNDRLSHISGKIKEVIDARDIPILYFSGCEKAVGLEEDHTVIEVETYEDVERRVESDFMHLTDSTRDLKDSLKGPIVYVIREQPRFD